ncbi:beta-mannosidase [Christiangramia fulva]|uniref:Mannan endo-1,4-beta-mannosidase n=1 Tax=Christiangramia fulva TaxID=2126553 RepID=A0A2R3Z2W4_9FLAO|nr:glycosyl hydrolase [Christiangramia fulva]AVR44601.1 beta-mannosidase [Christiangramia fulva]
MKNIITLIILSFIALLFTGCNSLQHRQLENLSLADKNTAKSARILYLRLKEIADRGIAFGQQDATLYGINWKQEQNPMEIRSDIKDVSGKLPAVHGYELGHIELGNSFSLDTVSFVTMRDQIKKIHKRGAIITCSWHLDNPVTGGSSWDKTPAVAAILKEGTQRGKYELWIKRLADFFKSLTDEKGDPIPVVFRPFHEMNGNWFWWGAGNCTPEEYKALWRQSFQLLQENGVHNLLFAYSPNIMQSREDFERFYPGDDYVDILGADVYNYGGREAYITNLQRNIAIIKEKGLQKSKLYALTETGNTTPGSDANFWTESLYPGIKDSGIAWVLLWRNARLDHYFSTYPQDISAENFKKFEELKETLFLNEVQKIKF